MKCSRRNIVLENAQFNPFEECFAALEGLIVWTKQLKLAQTRRFQKHCMCWMEGEHLHAKENVPVTVTVTVNCWALIALIANSQLKTIVGQQPAQYLPTNNFWGM